MRKIICLFAAVAVAAAMSACPAGAASAGVSENVSVNGVALVSAAKAPKGEIKTVVFATKLHCKNCVAKVNENISFEKGVKDLKVDLEAQTITIKYAVPRLLWRSLRQPSTNSATLRPCRNDRAEMTVRNDCAEMTPVFFEKQTMFLKFAD